MSLLDDVLVQLRLRARFRWGRVTGLSPLMVQLDGDTAPLAPSDTLIDPAGLVVGDRVRCEMSMLRLVVHARVVAATATRAGFAELATQSEVDTGTDGTRIVTPKTVRERDYAPWAMAAGVGASGANASNSGIVYWDDGVTVTLPAGRFTSAPIITVTPQRSDHMLLCVVMSRSASSFTVRTVRLTSAVATGTDFRWIAVQMTPAGASG